MSEDPQEPRLEAQPPEQPALPAPPPSQAAAQPVYVSPPSNGLAVAALVLGIIGVVCGFIPILFILTFILGALGVIFGAIARSKATKDPGIPRKGMATAGLVLGIIALALGVVGVVIVNSAVDDLNDDLDQLEQDLDDYPK